MIDKTTEHATRKAFPFFGEDENLDSLIERELLLTLGSGKVFTGYLEGFDESHIFLRGRRSQRIVIRRRAIAAWEVL